MAVLTILHYPDERLHTVAKPVTMFGSALEQLIADMAETMYAAPGIGLAATQIDVHQRLVVIDVSESKDQLLVLVNPVIVARDGVLPYEEGCLSLPGIYETVERAQQITVQAQDRHGKSFTLTTDGLLAICIQHELDHLDGRVFVEYLSRLKQNRIRSKLLKNKRKVM